MCPHLSTPSHHTNFAQACLHNRQCIRGHFFGSVIAAGLRRGVTAKCKADEAQRCNGWQREYDRIEAETRENLLRDGTDCCDHIVMGSLYRVKEDWLFARREYTEVLRLTRTGQPWRQYVVGLLEQVVVEAMPMRPLNPKIDPAVLCPSCVGRRKQPTSRLVP